MVNWHQAKSQLAALTYDTKICNQDLKACIIDVNTWKLKLKIETVVGRN